MEWVGPAGRGYLRLLDQTALPERTRFIACRDVRGLWDAIRRLAVRGAPAIGVAAAYGMVLAAREAAAPGVRSVPVRASRSRETVAQGGPVRRRRPPYGVTTNAGRAFLPALERLGEYLISCRPTAVNLAWAVRRQLEKARNTAGSSQDAAGGRVYDICEALLAEARAIHAEDEALCLAIGRHAAPLIARCAGVLTHCNAGALATAGIGTATAGMYLAAARGKRFRVYCDETRPLLQGSRLTAWELLQAGIDAVVITDSMAAQVMRGGRVQMVITGADRIAANGDAANKIGTYGLAILARHHKIPFYVAAPYSTFDLALASGAGIPIEERGSEEIVQGFGRRTAPLRVKTFSPAFDVTPAELITAIITDRGVIQPVNRKNVLKVIREEKALIR